MPLLLAAAAALLALPLLFVLMLPFSMMRRYRMGTARRRAWGWVAALNAWGMGASMPMFLGAASISGMWIPGAFSWSFWGMAGGCALGLAGLRLAHWETAPGTVHFTQNRWLVLTITAAVSLKIAFGLWRMWRAWHETGGGENWIASAGVAGSMAAGALVLGYYTTFWGGVWLRVRRVKRSLA